MNEEKTLGNEMLKQNGLSPNSMEEHDRAMIQEALARDRKRINTLKKIVLILLCTAGCFILLFIIFMIGHSLFGGVPRAEDGTALPESPIAHSLRAIGSLAFVLSFPLAFLGVIMGVITFFLSRSADYRTIMVHLAHLERHMKMPDSHEMTSSKE